MARVKQVINLPLQESITREIKREYGAFISRAQLREYLCVGKNRRDIFESIPTFTITPGKISYRASDVAAWLAENAVGAAK